MSEYNPLDKVNLKPGDIQYLNSPLKIPVQPTQKKCDQCGKEATPEKPNRKYRLAGIVGVLCPECMDREIDQVNKQLKK
jgi:Zn finger protein HypA/HybF involved in hydrogenase expression